MKHAIAHILSLLIGGFFIWAGFGKIMDPAAFYESILNYKLVGENIAWPVALFLPWLEVIAGLGLILPWTRLGGLTWISGMLLVFIAALASAAARGLNIDCGCTGSGGTSVTFALVRNVLLLAALVGIFFLNRSKNRNAE